ncbi:MAG: DUF6174 domain-containing protein [Anaerolineales bacterium]
MKHSTIRAATVLVLLAILWLTSCDGGSSLSADITRGESKWQSQDIQNYIIEVAHSAGTWHYQTHTITVQNGEVIDASATCIVAPMETALGQECEVQAYDPEDYTIPGLFKLAWAHFENFPTQNLEVEFDPDYGFPTAIRYDDPDILDDDQYWGVKSFRILEEGENGTSGKTNQGENISLSDLITQSEGLWQSKGGQNYQIEVSHASGTWHYQTYKITVQNGQVMESIVGCVDAPMETALGKSCEVEPYDSNDFTVAGLFNLAKTLLASYPEVTLHFEFDPVYGYPALLRYDDPEIVDEEQAWSVKSFEIINE